MNNVNFSIGRTRNLTFTKEERSKLQAGLDIFLQAVNSKLFKTKVVNYQWRDAEGLVYNRFHLCKGMTNDEVLGCFENLNMTLGTTDNVINIGILPCRNRKDISTYSKMTVSTIWINKGCLNNEWYTPVHVASCIAHEYCINLGFNSGVASGLVPHAEHTVPYACGKLLKEVAAQWENRVTDIQDSFDLINEQSEYEYLPCSTTFQLKGMEAESENSNEMVKALKKLLKKEIKSLKNLKVLSNEEFERLYALEKSIYKLKSIQSSLKKTSLDGIESIDIQPTKKEIIKD